MTRDLLIFSYPVVGAMFATRMAISETSFWVLLFLWPIVALLIPVGLLINRRKAQP